MQRTLYVATHNQHKIAEISQLLPGFEILSDNPKGIEENAETFEGNAFIKVRAIAAAHSGAWVMADDSGLEVEALNGAPGVRSARYAGEEGNTAKNNAKLLAELRGKTNRSARFTCCVALVDPHGSEHVVTGYCQGRIAETANGTNGFGYDPLFIPAGFDVSFAELPAGEKNKISHRGQALAKMMEVVNRFTAQYN